MHRDIAGREQSRQERRARRSRGQNTVEYLMMLAVVVGVILVVGKMFKPQVSGIFNQVMTKVSGTVDSVSGTQ